MQGVEAREGIDCDKATQGKASRVFLRAGREIEEARIGSGFLWEKVGSLWEAADSCGRQ
jgi:hypothetical protein